MKHSLVLHRCEAWHHNRQAGPKQSVVILWQVPKRAKIVTYVMSSSLVFIILNGIVIGIGVNVTTETIYN